jgi:TRAP-type mannitol/chloroaromatic compound transport system permease small subunit
LFKKQMQRLDHIIERVAYYAIYVAGIITLLMALVTTYGVVRRYALDVPEPYSYEIGIFCLISSVCLSLAYIQRQDRNLRVDMVSNHFNAKGQGLLLNIIVPLIAMSYLITLVWQSLKDALYSLQVGERTYSAWGPIVYPIKLLVPIGAALLCIVLISQLVRGIHALTTKSTELNNPKKD